MPHNDTANDRIARVVHRRTDGPGVRRVDIRTMPGSSCRVSRAPECSVEGDCVARLEAVGASCVVLVTGIKASGEVMEPYCRDLSVGRADSAGSGAAWERCNRQVTERSL